MSQKDYSKQQERASVRRLVEYWEKGGIPAIKMYLENSIVFEDTWIYKIKTLINEGHIRSVNEEIDLISINIDLVNKIDNKLKENDEQKS
jgi:hypothetical protein